MTDFVTEGYFFNFFRSFLFFFSPVFWWKEGREEGRKGGRKEGKGREGKGREGKGREGKGGRKEGRKGTWSCLYLCL